MSELILLRHGQSVWNKLNLFTGWVNVGLSQQGIEEALAAGTEIQQKHIDIIFVSSLIRAQQTALLCMSNYGKTPILINQSKNNNNWQEIHNDVVKISTISMIEDSRLNERYYGDLQGMNKQDAIDKYGEEQVHIWRRSFATPPPGGESLSMTCDRTIPALKELIIPELEQGKNILVVAHGNSLRSIMMYAENISEDKISKLEIATGKPIYYKFESGNFKKST